jgi:ABC-type phosphate/phosphonate transport system substrate-binding protein
MRTKAPIPTRRQIVKTVKVLAFWRFCPGGLPAQHALALSALLTVSVMLSVACSMVQPTSAPLGTEQNPVKLALAPTTDPQKVLVAGEPLVKLLERETGLRIKLSVPTSYAATIEAMGTHNVDVGWLAPLAYVLAHDRVGAEVLAANVKGGSTTSSGQLVVRAQAAGPGVEGTMTPDLAEQLRVIARMDPIPNDVVGVRRDVPPEVERKLQTGLLKVAASPAGATALRELYGIDGLGLATDAEFGPLRATIRELDLDLDAELAPRRRGA